MSRRVPGNMQTPSGFSPCQKTTKLTVKYPELTIYVDVRASLVSSFKFLHERLDFVRYVLYFQGKHSLRKPRCFRWISQVVLWRFNKELGGINSEMMISI